MFKKGTIQMICSLFKIANQLSAEINDGTVKKTSSINKLAPQLDDQLLRFGGRLRNAPISEKRKHQIIIPKAGCQVITKALPRVGRT